MLAFDAILFDLDGTLLDSLALIVESYRHTLATHGLPPRSDEEVLAGLGTPLEVHLGRWAESPDDVPALVEDYIRYNLSVHDRYVKGYPGMSEPQRVQVAEPVVARSVAPTRELRHSKARS